MLQKFSKVLLLHQPALCKMVVVGKPCLAAADVEADLVLWAP
jgi:hypothetical protein